MKDPIESLEKKEVVVFSLDYDNSVGMLLSDGNDAAVMAIYHGVVHGLNRLPTLSSPLKSEIQKLAENQTSKFNQELGQELIRDMKAEFFELYHAKKAGKESLLMVGSNRQDPTIDIFNSYRHKTLLCHDVYRTFAEQEDIQFSELLLPDIFALDGQAHPEPKPIGTTMRSPKIEFSYEEDLKQLLERILPQHKLPDFKDNKRCLLQTQLQHIATRYPEDKYNVHFVFIDDLKEIIEQNLKALHEGDLVHAPHIRCEIIRFDLLSKIGEKLFNKLRMEATAEMQTAGTKRKSDESVTHVSVFNTEQDCAETPSSSNKMSKR